MKIKFLIASFCVFLIFSFKKATPTRQPNIIYVMADDLGYGDLSCYGQKRYQTPNLDKMAKEGIRFTDFHSGSTVCAPSRCALMTGKSMGNAYIRGNGEIPLRDEDFTMAEYFKQNGYRTGMFGKWGLGLADNAGSPEKQGWDEFLGYTHHVHAHHYFTNNLWTIRDGKTVKYPTDSLRHSHLYVMDAAVDFVKINKSKPFFLYLAMTMPHAEVFAPTPGSVSPFLNADNSSRFQETPYLQKGGSYRSQEKPRANFAGMVTHFDRDMGNLMQLLKELGLDENTYVFFTSDNGPHQEGGADPVFFDSNGPLRGIKRDLYEGGIRVPFIAWGGKVKKGLTNQEILANYDVFPTFEELVGGSKTKGLDGLSFSNSLKGKPMAKKHDALYWEFYERGFDQAVRMGDWKAVRQRTKGGKMELYHLKNDLGEEKDVAAQYPDIVAKAEKAIALNRTESPMWPLKK
ncbi:sulfatase-like hydrolase/transferase [Emticicia sp. CRIBPO]|uniref:arylsulfatase n=1 Tax=Emticicia sp. CRIBPO TaxID=2683258 RepID=UPI00141323A4|nr:arylsulfatase [Emticicia sp. CRIBPO]NBA88922.1 sulfatase-like hydrolase/transferase [Emticicia sp. CRIBPO]